MSTGTISVAAPAESAPRTVDILPRPANSESSVLNRNLAAIIGDGTSYSVMVGLGETFLPAFGLFLGLGEVTAGLIAALPMLFGAVLQLASPWAVRQLGSYRKWVVLCAAVQGLSLMLALTAEWITAGVGLVVYLAATLYWASGLAAGPAWNTWVEEIVPQSIRARFFARRQRFSQAGVLVGFVLGGCTLQLGKAHDATGWAFAFLFLTGAVCRFFSSWCLSRQSDAPLVRAEPALPWRQAVGRLRGNHGANLLGYMLLVQVFVQMSGPYFTPFMLQRLGHSFLEFTTLIGLAFLGKTIASPFWGRCAQRIGAQRLLWIGGLAIVPMSGMWWMSQSFWYLAGLQLVSGMAWAAYELAMFLTFFDAVPRRHRTTMLTWFNLANSAALVVGALAGGAVLNAYGKSFEGYTTLFLLSSGGRLLAIGVLTWITLRATAAARAAGSLHLPGLSPTECATGVTAGMGPRAARTPGAPPRSTMTDKSLHVTT